MVDIIWRGKSTNGLMKWDDRASSFMELYHDLVQKKVITEYDESPYETAVLEKYGKTIEDFCDDLGYPIDNELNEFMNSHGLTDEELWILIAQQNGNAYYQTFQKFSELEDSWVDICEFDFDSDGNFCLKDYDLESKKFKVFCNYGVLDAELRNVFTYGGEASHASCSDEIIVQLPENDFFVNLIEAEGGLAVKTVTGSTYLISEVLCGDKNPCLRVCDDIGEHRVYLDVVFGEYVK